MRIRLAADADLPALNHLYQERAALLAHDKRRAGTEDPRWFERTSGGIWVAEVDGAVVGYVSARQSANALWVIDHMALDAHTYYPGMGRALVGAVRDAARELGVLEILVRVPLFQPVEQAFWRALGASAVKRAAKSAYQWMQLRV